MSSQASADEANALARRRAARPWWRTKRYAIPGALLVLFVLVGIVAPDRAAEESTELRAETTVVGAVGIGETARDGDFAFMVTDLDCGEATVGEGTAAQTAQGMFCRMRVAVDNRGAKAGSLLADNQFLIYGDGRRYPASSEAMLADRPNDLSSEIGPGNRVLVDMLFDVPAGRMPVAAELHDSALSGGVRVDLT